MKKCLSVFQNISPNEEVFRSAQKHARSYDDGDGKNKKRKQETSKLTAHAHINLLCFLL